MTPLLPVTTWNIFQKAYWLKKKHMPVEFLKIVGRPTWPAKPPGCKDRLTVAQTNLHLAYRDSYLSNTVLQLNVLLNQWHKTFLEVFDAQLFSFPLDLLAVGGILGRDQHI